jgi:membrane protein DedA with SNARE-associated domain
MEMWYYSTHGSARLGRRLLSLHRSTAMNKIFALLLAYRYPILIPFSILEGPITTVIGGFFVSTGFMNPFVVYGIVVLSDIAGDALLYFIGYRGGGFLLRHGAHFGVTEAKMEGAKDYFKENHRKAIIFSKLFHGIGFTGLIAAGSLKVPYKRYFRTCVLVSIIQSACFLILGIFFGGAYVQISKYLNYFAALISVVALVIIIVVVYKYTDIKKIQHQKKIKDYE